MMSGRTLIDVRPERLQSPSFCDAEETSQIVQGQFDKMRRSSLTARCSPSYARPRPNVWILQTIFLALVLLMAVVAAPGAAESDDRAPRVLVLYPYDERIPG